MAPDKYRTLQWRKSLERRGWKNIRRGLPVSQVIEFHIVYRGQLYSGRCVVGHLDSADTWKPGTLAYLFRRPDQIAEGVWRLATKTDVDLGWVVRKWQP